MSQDKAKKRLSAPERRSQIIDVSARLFAKKGLHGVTTREIAKACKITEPVLYQHFRSKEQIYQELQIMCQGQTLYMNRVLREVPPGAFGLVLAFYLLCYTIPLHREPSSKNRNSEITEILVRLMGYSFLEDGTFAKVLIRDCIGSVMPYIVESYSVAQKNGDIVGDIATPEDLWLSYELIIGASLFHLTKPGLITSLSDDEVLLERSLAFVLRGVGLKESVIKKYHRPRDLKKWIGMTFSERS